MSCVYVTSDWHFGHDGITKYFRTQFPSLGLMEDHIMANALERMTKRDVLFCLGDMSFTLGGLDKIREIPGRKILVRGNHDTLSTRDYLSVFDEVEGAYRYKKYWLTHIPIHPMELYRGMNVHGHCHHGGPYEVEGDTRYFNAILEYNEYKLINMQDVGRIIKERHDALSNKSSSTEKHRSNR